MRANDAKIVRRGMRNAIKVPGVGFVGVLNRPLSIYHYSNMTLKLSGQNCNFF